MRQTVVIAFSLCLVGCTNAALPILGNCAWSLSAPQSSGSLPALFDYSTNTGCDGVTTEAQDFAFTVMRSDAQLFRVSFAPPSPHPEAGVVVDLSASRLFVSANGWACSDFGGTATIESTTPSDWRVDFEATCNADGHAFSGSVSGDTSHAYATP